MVLSNALLKTKSTAATGAGEKLTVPPTIQHKASTKGKEKGSLLMASMHESTSTRKATAHNDDESIRKTFVPESKQDYAHQKEHLHQTDHKEGRPTHQSSSEVAALRQSKKKFGKGTLLAQPPNPNSSGPSGGNQTNVTANLGRSKSKKKIFKNQGATFSAMTEREGDHLLLRKALGLTKLSIRKHEKNLKESVDRSKSGPKKKSMVASFSMGAFSKKKVAGVIEKTTAKKPKRRRIVTGSRDQLGFSRPRERGVADYQDDSQEKLEELNPQHKGSVDNSERRLYRENHNPLVRSSKLYTHLLKTSQNLRPHPQPLKSLSSSTNKEPDYDERAISDNRSSYNDPQAIIYPITSHQAIEKPTEYILSSNQEAKRSSLIQQAVAPRLFAQSPATGQFLNPAIVQDRPRTNRASGEVGSHPQNEIKPKPQILWKSSELKNLPAQALSPKINGLSEPSDLEKPITPQQASVLRRSDERGLLHSDLEVQEGAKKLPPQKSQVVLKGQILSDRLRAAIKDDTPSNAGNNVSQGFSNSSSRKSPNNGAVIEARFKAFAQENEKAWKALLKSLDDAQPAGHENQSSSFLLKIQNYKRRAERCLKAVRALGVGESSSNAASNSYIYDSKIYDQAHDQLSEYKFTKASQFESQQGPVKAQRLNGFIQPIREMEASLNGANPSIQPLTEAIQGLALQPAGKQGYFQMPNLQHSDNSPVSMIKGTSPSSVGLGAHTVGILSSQALSPTVNSVRGEAIRSELVLHRKLVPIGAVAVDEDLQPIPQAPQDVSENKALVAASLNSSISAGGASKGRGFIQEVYPGSRQGNFQEYASMGLPKGEHRRTRVSVPLTSIGLSPPPPQDKIDSGEDTKKTSRGKLEQSRPDKNYEENPSLEKLLKAVPHATASSGQIRSLIQTSSDAVAEKNKDSPESLAVESFDTVQIQSIISNDRRNETERAALSSPRIDSGHKSDNESFLENIPRLFPGRQPATGTLDVEAANDKPIQSKFEPQKTIEIFDWSPGVIGGSPKPGSSFGDKFSQSKSKSPDNDDFLINPLELPDQPKQIVPLQTAKVYPSLKPDTGGRLISSPVEGSTVEVKRFSEIASDELIIQESDDSSEFAVRPHFAKKGLVSNENLKNLADVIIINPGTEDALQNRERSDRSGATDTFRSQPSDTNPEVQNKPQLLQINAALDTNEGNKVLSHTPVKVQQLSPKIERMNGVPINFQANQSQLLKSGENEDTSALFTSAGEKADIITSFILENLIIEAIGEDHCLSKLITVLGKVVRHIDSTKTGEYLDMLKDILSSSTEDVQATINRLNTAICPDNLSRLLMVSPLLAEQLDSGELDFSAGFVYEPVLDIRLYVSLEETLRDTVYASRGLDQLDMEREHILHKMMFDAINEELDFRRLFGIVGPPPTFTRAYRSKPLIDQRGLTRILDETKNRIMSWNEIRAGTLLDKEPYILHYGETDELEKLREKAMGQVIAEHVTQSDCKWKYYEDEYVESVLILSESVLGELIEEVVADLQDGFRRSPGAIDHSQVEMQIAYSNVPSGELASFRLLSPSQRNQVEPKRSTSLQEKLD